MWNGILGGAFVGAIIGGTVALVKVLLNKINIAEARKELTHKQIDTRKKLIILIPVTGVLIIGGLALYHNNHYPSAYEVSFLASCENRGASVLVCGCSLRTIENNYSYSQAKSFDTNSQLQIEVLNIVRSNCQGL